MEQPFGFGVLNPQIKNTEKKKKCIDKCSQSLSGDCKKRKTKKIDHLRSNKKLQLVICPSSSGGYVDEFIPSKSEYKSPIKHTKNSINGNNLQNDNSCDAVFDVKRFFQEYNDIQYQSKEVLDGSLIEVLSGIHIFDTEDCVEQHDVLSTSSSSVIALDTDIKKRSRSSVEKKLRKSNHNTKREPEDSSNYIFTSAECPKSNSLEPITNCTRVKYYDLDDSKLVVLSGDVRLPFYGVASISVLCGKIEMFGVTMDNTSKSRSIYSPRGSSLLYIKNICQGQDMYEVIACLEKFQCVDISKLNLCFPTSIILCEKIHEPFMNYVEKHISQQILPKREEHLPQCIFEPTVRDSKSVSNTIETSVEWDAQIDKINADTRIMICGGKGVGKSTFLRYCINKLLMIYNKVCVIDLDPGQSEFTVAGCISIVTVLQPLLGPNYTHLQKTDCSILSDINVGNDPQKYLKSIKQLILRAKHRKTPVLINYMGYSRGIGLNIVSSVISIIKPTDVLLIQSEKSQNNFKKILSKDVVMKECQLFSKKVDIPPYNLIILKSLIQGNDGWSLVPRQMREMCLLAYFGKLMNASVTSILAVDLPMYETQLSKINIVDIKGKPIFPMAVNANVVTLCSVLNSADFLVHGWGIVRGMDLGKDILVLLTPLEDAILEKVDHMVVGNMTLPPSIIMTTDNVFGLVPYVHEGELLGSVTKRSYLPASKR